MVSGYQNIQRLIRADLLAGFARSLTLTEGAG